MSQSRMKTQQQLNHHANMLNDNKGTSGNNIVNAQMHGNRGKAMNPNQQTKTATPKLAAKTSKGRGK